MGTTLTGTTPQDTYDSLIKVTDNGPLSGTAKYLSDGLGNDSILALSTTALGIGTASPDSLAQLNGTAGTTHFRISESGTTIGFVGGANGIISGATGSLAVRAEAGLILSSAGNSQTMVLTSTGNVGIGTSSPASRFHVAGADAWMTLQRTSGTTNILDFTDSAAARLGYVGFISSSLTLNAKAGSDIIFAPNNDERGRFTSNGLTFNGDTAAANALDDYEEGTFTCTIVPEVSGSITLTTDQRTARYTKIGRQVSIQGYLIVSSVSSPVSTRTLIQGLPFTIANAFSAATAPTVTFSDASLSYARTALAAIALNNQSQIVIDINASTIAAGDEFFISLTYTV